MIIPIKTNKKVFYKVLLTLMNKFPPIRGLREKEIDVLAEIMYHNYRYRNIEFKQRHYLVFSTSNRILMQENLGLSEQNFNNYLVKLRTAKLLSKDNELLPFLNIIPDKDYSLEIKFQINE